MRCRDVQSRLSAFHDGELGRSEQEAVRNHLMDCPACRARATELRSISRWLAPEAAPASSAGFTQSVLARIRAGEGLDDLGVSEERRAARSLRWLSLAAGLLLTAGGVFLAMPGPGSRGSSGDGTLDAAAANDIDKEIERNNALARAAWSPFVASKPAAKSTK
jgi:anti-sigma factor RsiW